MARPGAPDGLRAQVTRSTPSTVRLALGLLVLLLPLGCVHIPPAPLTEATQAYLGTIGVVAAQVPPEVDYRTPGQGGKGGAVIGATKGVGLGVLGAAGCYLMVPQGCMLAVASPYLAVRYAVDQAREGVAPDTIAAAEMAITAVFAERNHQAVVRDEVFRVVAAQTGRPLVLLPGEGPRAAGETPRYTHLTAQGVDTVIEITLQRLALRWPQGGHSRGGNLSRISAAELNPYLTLAVTARTRVFRIADETVLYDHVREQRGRGATFPDWGANDAQLLRDSLAQLLREMAGEVVAQVFGVAVPAATEPVAPAPTPATEPEPQQSPSSSGAEDPAAWGRLSGKTRYTRW